jgi:hypothetical protein
MHTSACSYVSTVALLGLLAVLGPAMVHPARSWADTMRRSLDLDVAALPPHAKSPVEHLGDPRIEPERARPRRKPAGIQRA